MYLTVKFYVALTSLYVTVKDFTENICVYFDIEYVVKWWIAMEPKHTAKVADLRKVVETTPCMSIMFDGIKMKDDDVALSVLSTTTEALVIPLKR